MITAVKSRYAMLQCERYRDRRIADVPGCSPAQSAAVTAIPGIVFSGGIDGHLRLLCQ